MDFGEKMDLGALCVSNTVINALLYQKFRQMYPGISTFRIISVLWSYRFFQYLPERIAHDCDPGFLAGGHAFHHSFEAHGGETDLSFSSERRFRRTRINA